jgi:DNA primase
MPGIDFDKLRREITMKEVLNLLDFEPTQRSGDQWYGPCPLHASTASRPRHFSVNVVIGRYRCHKCHSQGNQLELWAAFTKLSLYQAAIHLCQALGRKVPWVRHW